MIQLRRKTITVALSFTAQETKTSNKTGCATSSSAENSLRRNVCGFYTSLMQHLTPSLAPAQEDKTKKTPEISQPVFHQSQTLFSLLPQRQLLHPLRSQFDTVCVLDLQMFSETYINCVFDEILTPLMSKNPSEPVEW